MKYFIDNKPHKWDRKHEGMTFAYHISCEEHKLSDLFSSISIIRDRLNTNWYESPSMAITITRKINRLEKFEKETGLKLPIVNYSCYHYKSSITNYPVDYGIMQYCFHRKQLSIHVNPSNSLAIIHFKNKNAEREYKELMFPFMFYGAEYFWKILNG